METSNDEQSVRTQHRLEALAALSMAALPFVRAILAPERRMK